MKNEILLTIGWVTAIQGGLGAGGRLFGEGPWGLLHRWWDVPTSGYLALLLVGAVLAVTGERAKRART
ncbi:hypothetical protein [Streptomyces clavuligerus]|uniref:hypothetical protein n=1 Tax=Streptomyces clavuligerus TaxID=1901 RepID=UPI00020D9656|nr:hypothetical protein [Streptomyces clavuligerus]ANW18730.1 hypothetical protein BB341_11060 [Streptomyces clavuligerus]AXU13296.1 hypothetical protein D1794_11435 [Streptomyces clavuligerus]MBY6303248.1 hypothetical protein [Streptomyces clavuligerus]QCS06080.1 hypothetical protein CRV15_10865 [Streptomyces clavuligerus]QPJ94560.1 hypothetical protein GE265_17075 [Streptomyces clavuligerus]